MENLEATNKTSLNEESTTKPQQTDNFKPVNDSEYQKTNLPLINQQIVQFQQQQNEVINQLFKNLTKKNSKTKFNLIRTLKTQ